MEGPGCRACNWILALVILLELPPREPDQIRPIACAPPSRGPSIFPYTFVEIRQGLGQPRIQGERSLCPQSCIFRVTYRGPGDQTPPFTAPRPVNIRSVQSSPCKSRPSGRGLASLL